MARAALNRLEPRLILLATALWLASTWTLILAVDFFNIADSQLRLLRTDWILPFLWWEIYREARFTELLQWLFQATAAVLVYLAARRQQSEKTRPFLQVLAFGLLLMLIEDSLNFRHHMADSHLPLWFGQDRLTWQWRAVWESSFYAVMSCLLVLPALAIWRVTHRCWQPGDYGLAIGSYFLYGLVGFGSALRKVFDWQSRLGESIIQNFNLLELPSWALAEERMEYWRETSVDYDHSLGFVLVDHLVEESVEFLAAGLLLATMVVFIRHVDTLSSNLYVPKH